MASETVSLTTRRCPYTRRPPRRGSYGLPGDAGGRGEPSSGGLVVTGGCGSAQPRQKKPLGNFKASVSINITKTMTIAVPAMASQPGICGQWPCTQKLSTKVPLKERL